MLSGSMETSRSELSSLRIRRDARPRRRRRRGRWLLVLLLLAAGVVYAKREKVFGLGPVVETTVVEKQGDVPGAPLLTASGYVTARRQAGVSPKVTGRIEVLHKDLGDRVAKDEVIAELEDADLQAALEESKATMWVAKVTAERDKKLLDERIGSQADYDISLAKYQEASARAKNIEEQIKNTKVRAPFDGVIIVKNGEVGETVSLFGAQTSRKSGPIFVVADFDEFEVEADVSESNIAKIEPGQPAEISLDAVPERKYQGKLRQVVPTADRQKATIGVKVSLLDPDDKVYPEMSARVTFLRTAGAADPVKVTVPASAVVERGGRPVTFVVDAGRVREAPVETVPLPGGLLEVRSGLSGGETVVLSPPEGLAEGGPIRVREKT
jgi:HlyD family secretion protein